MMQGFLVYFFIFSSAFLELNIINCAPTSSFTTFDVTKFGAIGDGKTDDTTAFQKAWASACSERWGNPKVIVPRGRAFLVSSIKFSGPCNAGSITFEILGSIVAHPREDWGDEDASEWLYFYQIEGLSVVGNGVGLIDGKGESWWAYGDQNSRPRAMRFYECNKLQINGLKHKDSQRNHISINSCHNATISNLHITAPAKSPNTDGIDINSSSNLLIQDCLIETGDDCIAINGGTSDLKVSRITCGPGHGISVGSLGKDGQRDEVEGIHVDNCTFIRTQNGVRIKTWQGGLGFAKNIIFSNIIFQSADNPVVIDQYYCPHKKCDDKASAVEISDVTYIGLRGTSVRNNGTINLSCSETVPCTGIVIDGLDITGVGGTRTSARCINAHGKIISHESYPSVDCLLP